MNAFDEVIERLTETGLKESLAQELVWEAQAADRAEVLAEAKREVVGWLLKKADEYRATGTRQREADAVSTMASKLDRGAVRLFLDEAGKVTRDAGEITQPAEKGEPADTCDRCRQPFDPSDARFDGRARHLYSPFCRRCVDRCHESTDAFHKCPVCAPAEGGDSRG
ncbi:hypothetical protein [Streptomyces asiaticus]|uniref:hypothetical protein n=1 Tax=Streptomyces asiaticus TaxID=114695 RepID=UPI00381CE2A7